MSIQFQFCPEKAVEAAAVLLKLHGKPMKYIGLLKMLYIADRIALDRMEQPITGDTYVSMDYGPVLSGVYDLIKQNTCADDDFSLWAKHISSSKEKSISLLQDPGNEELCEEEEEILQEVYQEFGHLDPFKVVDWTHDLPEWQAPHGSSIPIETHDILKHLGKSSVEIDEIRQETMRENYLDVVLNG